MAALGFGLSRRLYPLPFDARRLAGLGLAAATVYAAAFLLAPAAVWPAQAVKTVLLLTFPFLLLAAGFLERGEWTALWRVILDRSQQRRAT
jgi:hypothetical protein